MHTCPFCGWDKLFDNPIVRTYEICPQCGTEFGYDDLGLTHAQLRQEWVDKAMPWWSKARLRPDGWDPRSGLEKLLKKQRELEKRTEADEGFGDEEET